MNVLDWDVLQFLSLSHWASLVGVVLFFVLLYILGHLPKKKLSFATRVLIGSGAGTALGLLVWALSGGVSSGLSLFQPASASGPYAKDLIPWFSLVAKGYVALLSCLILPMVFLASIRLVVKTPAEKTVSKLTRWKKWVNTLMLVLSAGVALALGLLFKVGVIPDQGAPAFTADGNELVSHLSSLVPSGLGRDLVLANVAGIFVFGIYVGIAARRMQAKSESVKSLIGILDGAFSVGVSVCKTVIAYKPMGAGAIMAWLVASCGPVILVMIAKMLLVLILGMAAMLVLQTLLCALSGVSPAAFWGKGGAVMVKALKTRSGSGCLPDAQQMLAEGLGLRREVTDPVSAYAIASGAQGCAALFPTLSVLFALGLFGIPMTPGLIAAHLILVVIVSYGITELPGTATMSEFGLLMGIGASEALPGLGAMIAIDPIADVFRTLINVTGCMTNAIIVERRVKE